MTIDEFHVMEHRMGWKHEYWDGAAQLSCQETAVTTFRLDLSRDPPVYPSLPDGHTIRNVKPADGPALVDLFVRTFEEAVEFAGWDEPYYFHFAQRCVNSFFGVHDPGDRRFQDGLSEHSFAIHASGLLVGAILIRRETPLVQPIMIQPTHVRRGLGAVLLAATCESLRRAEVELLQSRCHLGNTASLNWHHQQGFQEIPSYFAANHRAMHYHRQADHQRSQGRHDQAAEMMRLAEYWESIAASLEPWNRRL